MRYAFIEAERRVHTVRLLCRVLGVSKAGYYAWRHRAPSARRQANTALATRIRTVHRRSRRMYGSPRVTVELRAQGVRCSENRVARVMQREGIRVKGRRRFQITTDLRHGHPIAPNVLARQFAVADVDRVWASDITYVPTQDGWLYLAVVLNFASRRVIGWAMRHTLERRLPLEALRMALAHRRPGLGVLHHSDRGSQYACGEYRALLTTHGMQCSMSRKGDCYDNAVVESFFATLKTELVENTLWATRDDARTAIFEYIEAWYNRERRHSSLGYRSPMQYEADQFRSAA